MASSGSDEFLRRIIWDENLLLNQNPKIARLLLPNMFLSLEISRNSEIGIYFQTQTQRL